jgi:hypothetical protein
MNNSPAGRLPRFLRNEPGYGSDSKLIAVAACTQNMEAQESLKHIEILGLRGFAISQRLELAVPNGKSEAG